jgi:hypothetical protein
MRELRQSWPLVEVTWYEIYLNTLCGLVRDKLKDAQALLWLDDVTTVLTQFQLQAVGQAIRMIRRHGSCSIVDVVGLGKSYVGLAVVKHLQSRLGEGDRHLGARLDRLNRLQKASRSYSRCPGQHAGHLERENDENRASVTRRACVLTRPRPVLYWRN